MRVYVIDARARTLTHTLTYNIFRTFLLLLTYIECMHTRYWCTWLVSIPAIMFWPRPTTAVAQTKLTTQQFGSFVFTSTHATPAFVMGAFHCKSCQNGEDVTSIFGQHDVAADSIGTERRRFIFGRHRSRSGSIKQTDSLVLQTLSVIKNLGLIEK